MKRGIIIGFVFVFLILGIFSVLACISFPILETKTNCSLSFDYGNYQNETELNKILETNKDVCGFNDEEINILKEYIINGYSVEEQTDEEYEDFLIEVKEQNNKLGCVEYYLAVSHIDRWTGYIKDLRLIDDEGNSCPMPECSSASFYVFLNDLDISQNITDPNQTEIIDVDDTGEDVGDDGEESLGDKIGKGKSYTKYLIFGAIGLVISLILFWIMRKVIFIVLIGLLVLILLLLFFL